MKDSTMLMEMVGWYIEDELLLHPNDKQRLNEVVDSFKKLIEKRDEYFDYNSLDKVKEVYEMFERGMSDEEVFEKIKERLCEGEGERFINYCLRAQEFFDEVEALYIHAIRKYLNMSSDLYYTERSYFEVIITNAFEDYRRCILNDRVRSVIENVVYKTYREEIGAGLNAEENLDEAIMSALMFI